MAEKFNLDSDEVIILKEESVCHGGAFAGWTDDLILTNKAITIVKKGVFGNVKNIIKYPLNDVKVYNDQAQAIVSKNRGGSPQLEIYFKSGEETFLFQNKRTTNEWAMKINEIITGNTSTALNNTTRMAIPGSAFIAKTIKGTVDTYKDVFGIKNKIEMVNCHCPSCGASVNGEKDSTGKCPYCDSFIKFQ